MEKKGGFKTPEEAEESFIQHKKEYEKSINKNYIINKNEATFKEYLVYWFESIYSNRVENTSQSLGAYVLYYLILPSLEKDIKLKFIHTEFLDDLLLKVSKICDSSGNKARELLNIAFKDAIIDGFITVNPVIGTKKYKRKKSKVIIFNKKELKTFLELASKDEWYLEILLGLFCGLRKGEILALKFSDVNKEEGTIQICRQLTTNNKLNEDMINNGFKIEEYSLKTKSPKTNNSYRILRVPKVILYYLEERKIKIENLSSTKKYIDNDFISTQKNGKPHSLSSLNQYITKLCRRNGLPPITVHSLRHMFATILLERGVSIVKISALLGHSSIHTTFEFYCDIMEEEEKIKEFMNKNFNLKSESVKNELK